MRTTLVIDDGVFVKLRQKAAKEGKTISELVECALRLLLRPQRGQPPCQLPELPVFDGGGAVVDVADRDALFRAMEED